MKCLPHLGMNASLILPTQEMNKAENHSNDAKDATGTFSRCLQWSMALN